MIWLINRLHKSKDNHELQEKTLCLLDYLCDNFLLLLLLL